MTNAYEHILAFAPRYVYSGIFLVCSIQLRPLKRLLADWACSDLGNGHITPHHMISHMAELSRDLLYICLLGPIQDLPDTYWHVSVCTVLYVHTWHIFTYMYIFGHYKYKQRMHGICFSIRYCVLNITNCSLTFYSTELIIPPKLHVLNSKKPVPWPQHQIVKLFFYGLKPYFVGPFSTIFTAYFDYK